MSETFVLLLEQVTIFSSVTALILIAVKQLFKCRIPPRIGMALWIVLLARLVCPVFPESRFSVYNLIPAGKDVLYAIRTVEEAEPEPATEDTVPADNPYVLTERGAEPDITPPAARSPAPDYTIGGYLTDGSGSERASVNRIVLIVYFAGVAVSMGAAVLVYEVARGRALDGTIPVDDRRLLRLYRETAERMGLNVKRLPRLCYGSSTMLAGVIRPAVICREADLAETGTGENRFGTEADRAARMVFAHELTHYRFGDNPILVFSTFVNCLFWFNPLIWVVRHIIREDVEVLCDARTLEFCGIPETEYAMMLCRESAFDTLSDGMKGTLAAGAGCHMSRKGRHLKVRLLTIARGRRRRLLPKAASWLLCASIVAVCLTNPVLSFNGTYRVYAEHYAKLSGENAAVLMRKETSTVSDYLDEISLLLSQFTDGAVSDNLEQLRRSLDAKSAENPGNRSLAWLKRELSRYKSDEVLTEKTAAAVESAMMAVLGIGFNPMEPESVLPAEISAESMEMIAERLNEIGAAMLLSAYNRGVPGAAVRFEEYYSEEMMNLILSRIGDEWSREKFRGFYQPIDLTPENSRSFSEELSTAVSGKWEDEVVYLRDPSLTKVEESILTEILGAAMAGEREDVYYLKQTEDVVSRETVSLLLRMAGYTPLDCLCDAARIGDLHGTLSDHISAVRGGFADEGIDGGDIALFRSEELRQMLEKSFRMGLAEIPGNGMVDPARKLSAGEGIARAYRFAAALVSGTAAG